MFKKFALLALLVSAAAAADAANISFVGNGYVILNINGAGDTFYDVNNQGNDAVTPSFDTDNTTPTAFSRTFTIQQGQSILLGGQEETFPSTPGTSAFLAYAITNLSETSGTFSELTLPFFQNNNNNDVWRQLATGGVEIGSNLAPGNYLLTIYEHATNNGDVYNNEGGTSGNNWEAQIVVVPEPSTLALLAAPAVCGALFFARRRRS